MQNALNWLLWLCRPPCPRSSPRSSPSPRAARRGWPADQGANYPSQVTQSISLPLLCPSLIHTSSYYFHSFSGSEFCDVFIHPSTTRTSSSAHGSPSNRWTGRCHAQNETASLPETPFPVLGFWGKNTLPYAGTTMGYCTDFYRPLPVSRLPSEVQRRAGAKQSSFLLVGGVATLTIRYAELSRF